MKKEKGTESGRPFRLAHQTLCITAFNFETESLIGYVEMLIHPLKPDLKRLKINSKQCRIYRVAINETMEATFSYNDPTLEICQGDSKQRNLDYFENCHLSAMLAVDSDSGNGELTIKVPQEAIPIIADMKPFRICVEFSLERPQGGVKFVVPDMDGTMLDRGAHLFTYGHENSSRLWFPCIDSYSEVCTWKLEFSVDMYMTAVSCGDLVETVYTSDLRKKTYHYYLSSPTSACNIALAVGPFEVLVDPYMHEVTHFCLPHMMPILQHSTDFLHEAFEFYEELLSSRYPYSCYKQVFVDQAYNDMMPYATMTIFSTNLLHTKRIIDQPPISRQLMAHAIAQQFFGCFMTCNSWSDAWLPKGIAGYLSSLYKKRFFGNNEYRHYIGEQIELVEEFEKRVGGVTLDPSSSKDVPLYFPSRHMHTISPEYFKIYCKKSHLILRMLELRIGRELLLQVLNKLLALAAAASQQKITSNTWSNLLLSTSSFLKIITSVTGKDIHHFIEQWVQQGGHTQFTGSFVFNRKRNVVELELKQDLISKGSLKYAGPLTVAIQELDGTFNHTFKIEENRTKFEITCHSKSRRHKKKKIPLCTGEEVDMDLGDTDTESPMLWLRIDPDMTIMRSIKLEQPDWMWQYMLRYERCVVAQQIAIKHLGDFPSPKTRLALTDSLENEKCFYKVRMEAAMCLSKVANTMVMNWQGPPAMMSIFRKLFGSHACPSIVRQNNFTNFQHYYLQREIPIAMATLRTVQGICPPDVFAFILELFKYSDNSRNKYADNYYRASLIDALANSVTPAVTTVAVSGMGPSTDALTADTKLILEELSRCLNLEKLLPCYKLTVTVSCLKAIRRLQKFGHLPSDPSIFKSYAEQGNFADVRLAALEALVDYVKVEASRENLMWLLEMVENDPEPYVKHSILSMLVKNPPFSRREETPLSTELLVDKLWRLMNSGFAHDSRLRCGVVDLYYALYGRSRPSCLPIPDTVMVLNLKDRTTVMNQSIQGEDERSSESFLKRPAEVSMGGRISPLDISTKGEHSQDGLKAKRIKYGSKSPEHGLRDKGPQLSPLHSPSPSPGFTTSPASKRMSFEDEFMKFSGVKSEAVVKTEAADLPIPSPSVQMSMSESITETPRVTEHMPPSQLSEDSGSNSLPGIIKTESSASILPTAFDSSMFASHITDSPGFPAVGLEETVITKSDSEPSPGSDMPKHKLMKVEPPSFMDTSSRLGVDSTAIGGMQDSGSRQGVGSQSSSPVASFTLGSQDSNSRTGLPQTGSPSLKEHKAKKKKKKNKHKHKHKHRHDKEKKDKPLDGTGGFHIEPPSSGPSATNSPAPQNAPSSPEFEVI